MMMTGDRETAHNKVRGLFEECFEIDNMNKIKLCMKTFPTMAIFLSKKVKVNPNKKKLPASKQNMHLRKEKSSIFDISL